MPAGVTFMIYDNRKTFLSPFNTFPSCSNAEAVKITTTVKTNSVSWGNEQNK